MPVKHTIECDAIGCVTALPQNVAPVFWISGEFSKAEIDGMNKQRDFAVCSLFCLCAFLASHRSSSQPLGSITFRTGFDVNQVPPLDGWCDRKNVFQPDAPKVASLESRVRALEMATSKKVEVP